VEESALTSVMRGCPSSTRRLLLASRREFEEASGSGFDVPTIACNNPAPPIFDEQIDQEKQQLLNDFEKLLNDKEYLDSDHSQTSEIQLCPENSALATISEQDLSQIAEISFPASSPAESSFSSSLNLNQPSTIYPGETSRNSNGVHSSVTLTLPVVTATSFEQQPINQLSGTTWPERIASFSVSQESSYINSNACNEVHEDTGLTSRPIIEEAQRNRPSVIVAARSRKRAIEEETNNEDAVMKPCDADVPPSVLEKRRKGNERCKRYRRNKKEREAEEDAELEDLAARNAFLREVEQRLTARKRKLQQAYLDLIRQKKIRFS